VRVHDFLTKIPVRNQNCLKLTPKILEAIKSLLFSFSFARPEVRFSFKVLKSKKDKANWTYIGHTSGDLMETARRIIGTDVSSQCQQFTIASEQSDSDGGKTWKVKAVLISATAGISS
jgi:DNA mismatch repair ATPase MutL